MILSIATWKSSDLKVRWMMKRICMFLLLILALVASYSYALDLPDDALRLLAEVSVDPCSICVKQKSDKAFTAMNARLNPGLVIKSDDKCALVKVDQGNDNELSMTCYPPDTLKKSLKEGEELPQLIFKFYTPEKRLVGISDNDYTSRALADLYHASKPGTAFEGRIRLIPYKYGDGPTYNYFLQTNRLLVHCVVLQLNPLIH
jgi:hypothetical protein